MAVVALPYIDVDEKGVARIAGSRSKVKFIVIDHVKIGMSPEAICDAYRHLNLTQVHAALAYYYQTKDAVDAQIAEDERFIAEMRAKAGEPEFVKRLRREGLLPSTER